MYNSNLKEDRINYDLSKITLNGDIVGVRYLGKIRIYGNSEAANILRGIGVQFTNNSKEAFNKSIFTKLLNHKM